MTPDDMICNDLVWCMNHQTTIVAYDLTNVIFDHWEEFTEQTQRMIVKEIEKEISFNQCGSLTRKWNRLLEDLKKYDP